MTRFWTRRAAQVGAFILLSMQGLMAAGGQSFSIKPPAGWVKISAVDTAAPASAPNGTRITLLDDHQTRVSDRTVERYRRHVGVIGSQEDLSDLSQVQIEFEPTYQTLTIHHIQLRRGDTLINALRPEEIKMLHREEELEQQIFNGSIQAVAILSDVRIGDILDVAYTISGDNPVLRGRFSDVVGLTTEDFVKDLRVRLLWPRNRKLFMRSHNPAVQPSVTDGMETEYVWERHNVTPIDGDDLVPQWFFAGSWVEVADFESWKDVVAWALPLYDAPTPLSGELKTRIDAIAKASTSAEARLLAALRLVQDEVRYLGIEMGSYSHQPTQPVKVLARRFGDCKDKTLLLTTILRALSIDAAPALVDTESGKILDARQPSPHAFDHAIVNVRLQGKTYWLDGTQTFQRGGLKTFYNPPYFKALVLRPESAGLEDIPLQPPTQPTVVSDERYLIHSLDTPVDFTVVTTYTGSEADAIRYRLGRTSLEKMSKDYLNYYAEDNPQIEASGPLAVKDDEAGNTIVITERYSIPNFWKDSIHYVRADRISEALRKPRTSRRTMPLSVSYPLHVRQHIEIEYPDSAAAADDHHSFRNDSIAFDHTIKRSGKTLTLDYSLQALRDHVPVKEVPQHLATVDEILDHAGYDIPSTAPVVSDGTGFLLTLSVFGVTGLAVWLVKRRRNPPPVPAVSVRRTPVAAGEQPASAVSVSGSDDMLRHLLRQSCRCGARFDLDNSSLREESLTYDGARLTVFRLHCAVCGAERDQYFKETEKAGSL